MKVIKLGKDEVEQIPFQRGQYAELYNFLKTLGKDEGAKIELKEESKVNENAPRNHTQAVHTYGRKVNKTFRTKHYDDHFFVVRVK